MRAPTSPINIVWLKRDLRLKDHQALKKAVDLNQPIILLYIWEPSLLSTKDYDVRHWRFVRQSLDDLNAQLTANGDSDLAVTELYGEAVLILKKLQKTYKIEHIFSHEEINIQCTFTRDKAVKKWTKEQAIAWVEFPHNGVRRGLKNRKDYVQYWNEVMNAPFDNPDIVRLKELVLPSTHESTQEQRKALAETILVDSTAFQKGGELEARKWLLSFIKERAKGYAKTVSLPHEARTHNSRISPYLAWGNLSVRQVYQSFIKFKTAPYFAHDLKTWFTRVSWRCHFMQKFESECRMEFENVNKAYNALDRGHDEDIYQAWKNGVTGFPLVDAAMRAVEQTGWINFRMRAMVISFLTHYCWQHWREGAIWLGSRFLDFEPGIHYPQVQMQAGTTGINTIRVYNPTKQAQEKDKDGLFIREFVPELAPLPTHFLAEPWKIPPLEQQFLGVLIGKDYPNPIIDGSSAHQKAVDTLWQFKKHKEVRFEGRRIMKKHVKPGRRWE